MCVFKVDTIFENVSRPPPVVCANVTYSATAVEADDVKNGIKIAEGDDEFTITRHSQFKVPINVINVAGETESRCSENEVKDQWNRLLAHIVKIRLRTGDNNWRLQ